MREKMEIFVRLELNNVEFKNVRSCLTVKKLRKYVLIKDNIWLLLYTPKEETLPADQYIAIFTFLFDQ